MKTLIKHSLFLLFLFSTVIFADAVTPPAVYTQDKPVITVTPDKAEFTIKLKSNATTGYSWYLRSYDDHIIAPVSHHYQRPVSQLVGAPGFETWTFLVKREGFIVPQVSYIRFVYSRPWEAADESNTQVEFKVTTLTSPSQPSSVQTQH